MSRSLEKFTRMYRLFARMRFDANRVYALVDTRAEANVEPLHAIMREWAQSTLKGFRVDLQLSGAQPSSGSEPMLFVGNHISYLDIMCLMAVAPVVFVAKQELVGWPVVGRAARSVGTVFVQRKSKDSRRNAGEAIARHFEEHKSSICIFPSGTTTLDEAKPWRWGAFEIARRYGLKIQPFRIAYRPLRKVAFIDDEALLPHLWHLLEEARIECSLEFSSPVFVTSPETDCRAWQDWNRKSLERFASTHSGTKGSF